MKKVIAMLLCVLMMVCMFAGCGEQAAEPNAPAADEASNEPAANNEPDETKEPEAPAAVAENQVDLMGDYVVTDPEGVEYDQRVALYMPTVPGTDQAEAGMTDMYVVLYGMENKGVYMYTVEVFESAEKAAAYAGEKDNRTLDGNVVVTANDAAFFAAMESFIPTLETWINSNKASGMMEVD